MVVKLRDYERKARWSSVKLTDSIFDEILTSVMQLDTQSNAADNTYFHKH